METVKVSSKGQIVIPKALREAGHIRTGTELMIFATADGLMLAPAQRIKPTKVADGLGHAGRVRPQETFGCRGEAAYRRHAQASG